MSSKTNNQQQQILVHHKTILMAAAPKSSSSPPPPHNQLFGNDVVIKINDDNNDNETHEVASSTKIHRGSSNISNTHSDSVNESPGAAHNSSYSESPTRYGQPSSPRDHVKVSFTDSPRNLNRAGGGCPSGRRDEWFGRASNKSFSYESKLTRMKSRSRLVDPPDEYGNCKRTMKSGFIGNGSESDDHDDDPLLEQDFPQDYKKIVISKLAVIQFLSMFLTVAAIICSLTVNISEKNELWGLELWRWGVLFLTLISGRLVAGWGIRVVVFLVQLNCLLRKRVLFFVYGLRNAVKNCLWLALVLFSWRCLLVDRVEKLAHGKVFGYVTRSWVCLLVGTLIWFVKTLLVKVLASSFHVSTFFDRIQDALFNQYVIETLSGPPLKEIQQEAEEEEQAAMAEVHHSQTSGATVSPELKQSDFPKNSGKLKRIVRSPICKTARKSFDTFKSSRFSTVRTKKKNEGITIDHLHKLDEKNVSAWNMKKLINIVRKGSLSTLDDQIEDAIIGDDEIAVHITTEFQAGLAAKKIFCNVAKPGAKLIFQDDLMHFMRDDEALKTISLFEGASGWKGVSRRALKDWMVNAFRERRALALSLNDTKKAVNQLHRMLNIFVGGIISVIWLLILRVASTHFFVLLSSQILLVVFVFGNTCKTLFEGIVFLFVMHPFDIGDRCEVDGVQLVVEEMNILTTIFLRYDNLKISYPNSVLATMPISNYYRSPDMGDAIDFCIHVSTPAEKIDAMKEKITSYIEKKSDHWYPAPMIVVRDIEDLNRLKISIWLSHRINFQDMGERWVRRALLVEEMVKIFRELDIEYRTLPLDMNVRNMPALRSDRLPSNWTACDNNNNNNNNNNL